MKLKKKIELIFVTCLVILCLFSFIISVSAMTTPTADVDVYLTDMQFNTFSLYIRILFFLAIAFLVLETIIRYIILKNKLKEIENTAPRDDAKYDEIKEKIQKEKSLIIIKVVLSLVMFLATWFLQAIQTLKPIIYIYPEEDNTDVDLTLSKPDKITCSYPKYNNGWKVTANKDGTIRERGKDRQYYSLYWEGLIKAKKMKDGFVVRGEDTAKFLEEKLAILGLTDKEAEEFIVYWLPKMQNNKYNLIRFLTTEELNEEMELRVIPEPETLIRIQMQYKPLSKEIEIPEQQLLKIERKGYTVVEWGGSQIK